MFSDRRYSVVKSSSDGNTESDTTLRHVHASPSAGVTLIVMLIASRISIRNGSGSRIISEMIATTSNAMPDLTDGG